MKVVKLAGVGYDDNESMEWDRRDDDELPMVLSASSCRLATADEGLESDRYDNMNE